MLIINLSGKNKKGFTLVELMVVIAIIAILAAIAIPNYLTRKQQGCDSAAISDAKNAFTAAQAYFTDYPSKVLSAAVQLIPYGFSVTDGVSVTVSGGNSNLQIISTHNKGSKTYTVDPLGNIAF